MFHFYNLIMTMKTSAPRFYPPLALAAGLFLSLTANAQILVSAGNTYSQNFDALAIAGESAWTDNSTLPGWYAAAQNTTAITDYTAGTGADVAAGLHSFGVDGPTTTNLALGTLADNSFGDMAYGLRFTNDTAQTMTNFTITYTGEQWRRADNSSNALQTLAFSYAISAAAITNADPAGTNYSWTAVTDLNFSSPQTNGVDPTESLDGHAATNQQIFSSAPLPGVALLPGQEIFFRWLDADDAGPDHSLAIDDVSISFAPAPPPGIRLSIQRIGTDIVVTWDHPEYLLLESDGDIFGPYNYVQGGFATSPYTNSIVTEGQHYFMLTSLPAGGS